MQAHVLQSHLNISPTARGTPFGSTHPEFTFIPAEPPEPGIPGAPAPALGVPAPAPGAPGPTPEAPAPAPDSPAAPPGDTALPPQATIPVATAKPAESWHNLSQEFAIQLNQASPMPTPVLARVAALPLCARKPCPKSDTDFDPGNSLYAQNRRGCHAACPQKRRKRSTPLKSSIHSHCRRREPPTPLREGAEGALPRRAAHLTTRQQLPTSRSARVHAVSTAPSQHRTCQRTKRYRLRSA